MIFVTVGSDTPFDRLIQTVDLWARDSGRNDVFAQIGTNAWEPESISYSSMVSPAEFKKQLQAAHVVVGHAGMGTILSALQACKPLLVMPRRGHLGETRNDHQMDTAKQLLEMGKINVAFDEEELLGCLNRLHEFSPKEAISPFADTSLTGHLRDYIHHGKFRNALK